MTFVGEREPLKVMTVALTHEHSVLDVSQHQINDDDLSPVEYCDRQNSSPRSSKPYLRQKWSALPVKIRRHPPGTSLSWVRIASLAQWARISKNTD